MSEKKNCMEYIRTHLLVKEYFCHFDTFSSLCDSLSFEVTSVLNLNYIHMQKIKFINIYSQ